MQFEIVKRGPGLARAGVIKTAHGEIKTPAFMVVGTQGYVRSVNNQSLRELKAQAMLSNGYHLRRKAEEIAEAGGLGAWSGWGGPTLTDSGGFQIMSLGSGLGKVVSMEKERAENTAHKDRLAKVLEEGVEFIDPFDGKKELMRPEDSMRVQCQIGADIHMAFDELTSLADDYEYNVEALGRTERWATRSLAEHKLQKGILGYEQALYGVIQGGRWEDLRRSTSRKLGAMEFDGYGLGGAFLKEDLGKILRWCNEELPEVKPRHLLGLSHPDDIFVGTEMGADTFDCVAPTREARHGKLYTRDGAINLRKFRGVERVIEEGCDCLTCRSGRTMGELIGLWKSGDEALKQEYWHLVSVHNLRFIVRLTEEIRQALLEGRFLEFKEQFLGRYMQLKRI